MCIADSLCYKQKLTHHCKAIILQERCLKNKKNKKKRNMEQEEWPNKAYENEWLGRMNNFSNK